MASSVYSHRFIQTLGGSGGLIYTVPVGKRAVVQTVTMVNNGSAAATVEVSIGIGLVLLAAAPAKDSSRYLSLRLVLYFGEELKVFTTAANTYVSVHGYLFEDVSGERAGDIRHEPLTPGQLPGPA